MHDYTIDHAGSAELTCDIVSAENVITPIENLVSVSPNPFSDRISISTLGSFSQEDKIQIVDIHGRVVYTKESVDSLDLELSDLLSGVYFLRYTNSKGEVGISKIIKQ